MLKIRLKTIIAAFLFLAVPSIASAQGGATALYEAFNNSDANTISAYFNDNIEMVLPNTDNMFSKSQAKAVLYDFFRKNQVKKFVVVHKGNRENTAFTIGDLDTQNGNFRVSFFARKTPVAQHKLIYLLRIENAMDE